MRKDRDGSVLSYINVSIRLSIAMNLSLVVDAKTIVLSFWLSMT
jgi:hypothetical protein